MEDKKIFRSIDDYMIAGVSGGLAKYFKIDSTLVRIIFVLLAIGGGCGVLVYLILWLVIPKEKGVEKEIDRGEKVQEFAEDVKNKAKSMAKEIKLDTKVGKTGRVNILGIALILVGLAAIWNQISPMTIQWNFFWPGLLILIGILFLFRN